jgi:hypothetical protein
MRLLTETTTMDDDAEEVESMLERDDLDVVMMILSSSFDN